MNKSLIILALLLIPVVSAQTNEFVFKQFDPVDLKVVCYNNGYCSSASACNISVYDPENEIVINNGLMTNQNSYHNYTLTGTQTSVNGEYDVLGFCQDGTYSDIIDFTFVITPSGYTNLLGFFIIIIVLLYTITFVGAYFENPPLVLMGGMGLIILSTYLLLNGIDIYRDTITETIAIITLGIGAYFSITAGLKLINGD